MEYFIKLPLMLAMGASITLGMYFQYNQKPLSEVYGYLFGIGIVFYFLGVIIRDNFIKVLDEYNEQKKYETNLEFEEGNTENITNYKIDSNGKNDSILDIKVGEENSNPFVELGNYINKE